MQLCENEPANIKEETRTEEGGQDYFTTCRSGKSYGYLFEGSLLKQGKNPNAKFYMFHLTSAE